MLALAAAGLAGAYLVGAVPVGLLVARRAGGVDIRRHGSGNIGATNVLRTLGARAALLTLAGDVVKGAAAVGLAAGLAGRDVAALGALAAVVGNCWPAYLRFRGGKGMATGLGAFLAAAPLAVLPAAVVFALAVAAFRYVSLASLSGGLALPVAGAWLGYPPLDVAAMLAVAVIVVGRHHANIARLRAGTEPRLGRARPGPA
jgi:glycerol-3-phosphate acyltransferase PlsY